MSSGIDGVVLDKYITGNYGQDQFTDMFECESCGEWTPDDETFWLGDGVIKDAKVCEMCHDKCVDGESFNVQDGGNKLEDAI